MKHLDFHLDELHKPGDAVPEFRDLCFSWGAAVCWPLLRAKHPPSCSPTPPQGAGEENRIRKLVRWDKVRETACQLLLWVKKLWLGENEFNVLPMKMDSGSEKQRPAIKQSSIFSLPLPDSTSLLPDPAPHPTSSTVRHRDGHSQSVADPLSLFFHLLPLL